MCHWAIHKKIQNWRSKKSWPKVPCDFHPSFARPKLVKSNPQIVRDARCLFSRNSEEVPWFDRWTNTWEVFQSPQLLRTQEKLTNMDSCRTNRYTSNKGTASNKNTVKHEFNWPDHVLTWERLSGEKMVVLLAVKEEPAWGFFLSAWQQSDTDRQMIPINLCSKVHSVWVEEDYLNLLSRL